LYWDIKLIRGVFSFGKDSTHALSQSEISSLKENTSGFIGTFWGKLGE
jgi:hypothetical protein